MAPNSMSMLPEILQSQPADIQQHFAGAGESGGAFWCSRTGFYREHAGLVADKLEGAEQALVYDVP